MSIVKRIQGWSRRPRYREGRTLSRFIAPDIRREILIVSAARSPSWLIRSVGLNRFAVGVATKICMDNEQPL